MAHIEHSSRGFERERDKRDKYREHSRRDKREDRWEDSGDE